MYINSVRAIFLTTAAAAALTLTGCASTGDLAQLQGQVQQLKQQVGQAQQTADQALQKATAAQSTAVTAEQTATDTNQRLDRMFKKSMRK